MKSQLFTMKSQLYIAAAAVVLATAVLGLTTKSRLSSFPFRETLIVRFDATPPRLEKRIFCQDGENRQFSKLHHGWVCPTEPAPSVVE